MTDGNGIENQKRTLSDLVAVATLLAMLLAVVAWGLKLEGELNAVRDDVVSLKSQVGSGILPRAEERINQIQRRVNELGDDFDEHDQRHDKAD